MAKQADTIGGSIVVCGEKWHPGDVCLVTTAAVLYSCQRMSYGEREDSRFMVTSFTFRRPSLVLYVTTDARRWKHG